MDDHVVFVIPVYNEEQTIGGVIRGLKQRGLILQVVCDRKLDYVVQDTVSPVTESCLGPMPAKNGQALARVYSRNNTHLLQVIRTVLCRG